MYQKLQKLLKLQKNWDMYFYGELFLNTIGRVIKWYKMQDYFSQSITMLKINIFDSDLKPVIKY